VKLNLDIDVSNIEKRFEIYEEHFVKK